MAYTITLSDEEYRALTAAAEQRGRSVDELVHEALSERFPAPEPREEEGIALAQRKRLEKLYAEGMIANIPLRRRLSPEEQATREHLAKSIVPGQLVSDIVSEDREPH